MDKYDIKCLAAVVEIISPRAEKAYDRRDKSDREDDADHERNARDLAFQSAAIAKCLLGDSPQSSVIHDGSLYKA